MRAAALAALLLAGAARADEGVELGARLGWLGARGWAREALEKGAPAGEVFAERRWPGKAASLEASCGLYSLSGVESGAAVYTDGGGSVPTSFGWRQQLFVMPLRGTLKLSRALGRARLHAGLGLGGALSTVTRTLSFSHGPAQSAFGYVESDADFGFETHGQLGVDWSAGERLGLGLLARWSHADSGLALHKGFTGAGSSGATFRESRSAGNAAGLFLGGEARWRF